MGDNRNQRTDRALAVLLPIYLGMLLLHIDFGLPSQFHPDEPDGVVETTRLLSGVYELRYNHPPLLKHLAVAGLKFTQVAFWGGRAPTATEVTLALRGVSALAGVGGVLAVYLLATRFVEGWPALIAAALYGFLPLTVVSAKYGVPDTLVSFLFALALWQQIRLARQPGVGSYAAAGFLLSLAVGAKYNGAFLAPSALVAHLAARRCASPVPPARALAAFLAAGAAGLALDFPPHLTDWRSVWEGMWAEWLHLFVTGHRGFLVSGRESFGAYHLLHSVLPATGPLLLLGIVAGAVLLARRRDAAAGIVFAAVVPHYIASEWVYVVPPASERYALPLLGPYLAGVGLVLSWAAGGPSPRPGPPRRALGWVLAAALAAWPAVRTAAILRSMVPDTRDEMKGWMVAHLPPGSIVWMEAPFAYNPDLSGTSLRESVLVQDGATDPPRSGDYVLASSLAYDRYFRYPDQRPEGARFYRALFAAAPVHEVSRPEGRYLFQNPTLRLYAVP